MANFLGALPIHMGDADYLGRRRSPRGGHFGHGGGGGHQSYGSASTHAANQRANGAAGFVRPDLPGTPSRDAALLPAAFPPFSFALATGVNIIQQQMNVQVPFRGQRLSVIVVRNGASAALTAPLMSQFLVGQKPIITTPNGVALEIFNQNAFDTNLLMPPTMPGVIYSMNINLVNALLTTDTLLCLVGVIGSAVL
jgi:hypothetical protein